MILRRFMQHFKDQNWFAVGLDVVVVITGIFLGVKASNWNDASYHQESYKVAIKEFSREIDSNLAEIQGSIEKMDVYNASLIELQKLTQSCKNGPENQAKFIFNIGNAIGATAMKLRSHAINELLTNRGFDQVIHTELKFRIREYHREYEDVIDLISGNENLLWDNNLAMHPMLALFPGTSDSSRYDIELLEPYAVVCRDKMLRKQIGITLVLSELITAQMRDLLVETQKIGQFLNNDLKT